MDPICEFRINDNTYKICNVEKISGKKNYVGRSNYEDKTIYIETGNFQDMLITLKHELMHVWLYENGHRNQNNDEIFGYEDVCELAAKSNSSINRIVDWYIDNVKFYVYN